MSSQSKWKQNETCLLKVIVYGDNFDDSAAIYVAFIQKET